MIIVSAGSRDPVMKSAPDKSRFSARKPAGLPARRNASQPGARSAAIPAAPARTSAGSQWTFLTNHSHVLVLLSRNPSMVLRDVALQVGITERAVQRVISELEDGGFIERERIGRQNHYRIRTDQRLRHPVESHRTIGELLGLINSEDGSRRS